jgi:hypothetical protein
MNWAMGNGETALGSSLQSLFIEQDDKNEGGFPKELTNDSWVSQSLLLLYSLLARLQGGAASLP